MPKIDIENFTFMCKCKRGGLKPTKNNLIPVHKTPDGYACKYVQKEIIISIPKTINCDCGRKNLATTIHGTVPPHKTPKGERCTHIWEPVISCIGV